MGRYIVIGLCLLITFQYSNAQRWWQTTESTNPGRTFPARGIGEDLRIRLVNGYSYGSGRVEIFYNGRWGTICDDTFDRKDARVICRQLGIDYGYSYGAAYGNALFGQGTGPIIIGKLYCRGYEKSLLDCRSNRWGDYKGCQHSEDVGVDCYSNYGVSGALPGGTDQSYYASTVEFNNLRLINGYGGYSGRVEMYRFGEWMSVCSHTLTHNDVKVICRELGYYYGDGYGRIYSSSTYGRGASNSIVTRLSCYGHENRVTQCNIEDNSRGYPCDHSSDAGINCHEYNYDSSTIDPYPYNHEQSTSDYTTVRLVGGSSYYGRVEIYHNGAWMTVCSNTLDHSDVMTICSTLGYYPGYNYGVKYNSYYYGQGSSYNIIHSLNCNGYGTISQCGIQYSYRNNYCSHSQDAGINCYDYNYNMTTAIDETSTQQATEPFSRPSSTPVRLVGGRDQYSGRVEVYYRGRWGTICDDGFDRDDLRVVCRMLGMYRGSSYGVVHSSAYYGQGSGPITIDDMNCYGYESDVSQCRSNNWLTNDCSHSEDVGIDCYGYSYDLTTDSSIEQTTHYSDVRLVGGSSYYGRVEIYHNGAWMTVCSNTLDHSDVMTICRTLGYYSGYNRGVKYNSNAYGQGSSYNIIHSLNCNGYGTISQCGIQYSYRNNYCSHSQDAGINCYGYYHEITTAIDETSTQQTTVPFSRPSSTPVRLVGGHDRYSGRVEVYYRGRWGTICDDGFDRDDLHVVCRMLGMYLGSSYGVVHSSAYYGQGFGPITIDDMNCYGYESDVSQCRSNNWLTNDCSHSEDVGIDCYGYRYGLTTESPIEQTTYYSDVRLVGGNSYSGRVEIYHNGAWMTVCSNTLDHSDVMTICRTLGYYNGYNYGAERGSWYFGQGTSYNIIHFLNCNGYGSVSQCGIQSSSRNSYCSHSQDAGIDCSAYYYEATTTVYPYWYKQTTDGSVLDSAISVSCNEYGWDINVDMYRLRQQYPGARADAIYMGENSCVGSDNGYTVHFSQGLRQCLTSQTIRNDVLVYQNQLIYAERDPIHPFIIRNYNWTVDVECDVMRNETSSAHLHHDNDGNSGNHQITGTSHYAVNMSFFSDPNFRYELYGYPLAVKVGENVYVKVFSPTTDWTIKMKVHTCYTSPSMSTTTSQKYYIIKNGCEVDGNTHIISQSSHETRFVFKDFEYTTNHEGIYIFCDATFCHSSDYSSACSQTCNPVIRRRDLPARDLPARDLPVRAADTNDDPEGHVEDSTEEPKSDSGVPDYLTPEMP